MFEQWKADKHFVEFSCGGAAAFVNVLIIFPLYKSIFYQQLHGITWPQALAFLNQDGISKLYRGVLPPLLQRTLSGALMFGGQSFSEKILHKTSNLSKMKQKSLSAIYAAFLESALVPFERIQSVLQNRQYNSVYKNSLNATFSIYKAYGVLELYRGFTPILYRSCLGNVLYFCGRHITREHAPDSLLYYEKRFHDFATGGLLGAFVSAVTFPMNVVKARIHSKIGGPFESVGHNIKALVSEENGNVLRLYRGVPANFFRSMISWGIITMTYEALLELFDKHQRPST